MTSTAARRRATLLVASVLAVAGITAGALAAFGGASSGPTANDYFHALRRPMSAQDRGLGANTHFQRFAGGLGGYHAEPAQARVVSDSNGVLLTMIPTSSGGFCHTAAISQNATLLAEGALCSYGPQTTPHLNDTPVLYRAGTSRTPRPWVGILPDGLSNLTAIYSDGTQGAVPLTTDRAFTLESSKDVTAFTYTDSAGQSHRIAAG